jgi:hypothetical protein
LRGTEGAIGEFGVAGWQTQLHPLSEAEIVVDPAVALFVAGKTFSMLASS